VRTVAGLVWLLVAAAAAMAAPETEREFAESIRPVLSENCGACHNPANPKSRIDFLKSEKASDMAARRGIWRDVAIQLRNRTMPPMASKLTDADRIRVAAWVDNQLRSTACSAGDFAGMVPPRRLNRREYRNTVRDMLGVDFAVSDIFPPDETGGAGFDTNGETLYIPPMLVERYLEAAGKILDRVVVTAPLNRVFPSAAMEPPLPSTKPGRRLEPGQEVSTSIPLFVDGRYNLRVSIERPAEVPVQVEVKVDGTPMGTLTYQRDPNGGPTARAQLVQMDRGVHTVTVVAGKLPILFYRLIIEQEQQAATQDKRALHQRLFGLEPGEAPLDPRKAVTAILRTVLTKAYRRPVQDTDIERFLAIYDRSAQRGDPYEESVKLALKAVLVSPRFLFRVEETSADPAMRPLGQYEMASRLSYFLWATMPDDELFRLAGQGRLQDPAVLTAQVDRMIDDPRARAFASSFIGQWLNTQEVGGRVVPLLTELQHYYTPEVASDLRQEPVLLFHHLLSDNRSLLELLTANYSFLTDRLVRFYQVEGKVKPVVPNKGTVAGDVFQRMEWPDGRRAGILGMASVLAMTSHYRQGSPVLRGAWVLDTLLGTPVPPPPPDVPPLEKVSKSEAGLTMRQILARHRDDASCAACHNLMDPIGFGLENFDWMGRWRDQEADGRSVDASGTLPSGEKFNGPVELRQVLLTSRKDEFVRHLIGKTLGYALGRSLQDGDSCTIQRLAEALERDNFQARTLIRGIVLSVPFRNTNGGVTMSSAPAAPKRARAPLLGEK